MKFSGLRTRFEYSTISQVFVNYYVHETAVVEEGASIGEGTKIWHFAHVRSTASLGKNVIVGKSSYIDAEVKIGDNVKVQNLVSVYNGVTIGNDVFVGPHVAFTNDLHPRVTEEWEITRTSVEDGVSIGANSTIICGNILGRYSLIGAGSVVNKDVPPHALVVGNPARLIGWVCYCARKIAGRDFKGGKVVCEHCGRTVEVNL